MPVPAVQPDSHWAVVAEFDLHVGPEATGFHYEAGVPTGCYEVLDHWLGDFRKCGPGESWSSAPAGVGGEGELANHEKAALYVEDGPIETAVLVGEDTEV